MAHYLKAPPAPNLIVAPKQYDAGYQDKLNNVLRLYFNQLSSLLSVITGVNGMKYLQLPHGAWYDTTTQTAAAINTAYAVTFNSTTVEDEITKGTPTSRFYVPVTGQYNFQFSLQLSKASGGAAYAWVWPRINGVDVPDSNSKVAVQGTTAELVAAWNFILLMTAGDYFELMWATNDGIQLLAEAATAFAPAIPSAILTATFVSAS